MRQVEINLKLMVTNRRGPSQERGQFLLFGLLWVHNICKVINRHGKSPRIMDFKLTINALATNASENDDCRSYLQHVFLKIEKVSVF